MASPQKTRPAYAIASVDHALRLATALQLEGNITVAQAAERLGVARSTAHRLMAMLVYRDFAAQGDDRVYRPGPVLELAAHSRSKTSQLRAFALPHLEHLAALLDESCNVTVRTGDSVRFIASCESRRALRVGSREGMVFPAHLTTGGLLLLAELDADEVAALYDNEAWAEREDSPPDLRKLLTDLTRIRKAGFALNNGLSERGVVAVGVPVRDAAGTAVAGLSVSLPSVRYERGRLPELVATLHRFAQAVEADLPD